MNKEDQARLRQCASQQEEGLLRGLFSILSVNSERSEPVQGAPFGTGPRQALEKTMELARQLGFETEIVADQVGIAKYEPADCAGQPYVAALGHLDVVPAEGKWTSAPYEPEIRDGRIYARGALDNKGPILACLYAMKALQESGLPLRRPVWILFGTNEETGMEDIPVYLQHKEPPVAGFTPDCKFPVVYAERGRSVYALQFPDEEGACAWNAAFPDEKSLHLDIADPEFGLLQLRNRRQNGSTLELTASYPPCIDAEGIRKTLEASLPEGAEAQLLSDWKPVFYDRNSPFCRILQNAYEEVTGLDGTPVTTTGGTYAKRMPNIVPFGPSFPGQKGIAHLPDEWMDVRDLMTCLEIYTLALAGLAREDLGGLHDQEKN